MFGLTVVQRQKGLRMVLVVFMNDRAHPGIPTPFELWNLDSTITKPQ